MTTANGVVEALEDQSIVGLAFCGALTPETKPKEEEKEEEEAPAQASKKDKDGKSNVS